MWRKIDWTPNIRQALALIIIAVGGAGMLGLATADGGNPKPKQEEKVKKPRQKIPFADKFHPDLNLKDLIAGVKRDKTKSGVTYQTMLYALREVGYEMSVIEGIGDEKVFRVIGGVFNRYNRSSEPALKKALKKKKDKK